MKDTFWKVWGIPIVIGIFSGIGLISALTGDGVFDVISWLTLGGPVLLTLWYLFKKKKPAANLRTKSR